MTLVWAGSLVAAIVSLVGLIGVASARRSQLQAVFRDALAATDPPPSPRVVLRYWSRRLWIEASFAGMAWMLLSYLYLIARHTGWLRLLLTPLEGGAP